MLITNRSDMDQELQSAVNVKAGRSSLVKKSRDRRSTGTPIKQGRGFLAANAGGLHRRKLSKIEEEDTTFE
jgi:hypothetical protein